MKLKISPSTVMSELTQIESIHRDLPDTYEIVIGAPEEERGFRSSESPDEKRRRYGTPTGLFSGRLWLEIP